MTLPIPEALIRSLEGTAGFDKKNFVEVHQQAEGITSIRYNPIKLPLYPFTILQERIPWSAYGYYLPARPFFTKDPLFHAGLYYVQEAGSQFLWEALAQTIDQNAAVKVLDLCAAPGGKSTLLSSYFQQGLVVANEVIKTRASILVENLTKWGMGNIVVTNNDPAHFARLENFFDVVLIDAPCSGSGLFRKDNTAINQWSEENVLLCSRRQQRILSDAYPAVKENGLIIYATCSYSPLEDEENVDWIMQHLEVENIPLQIQDEWNITTVESAQHKAKGYKFYPDKTKSEGFFIAVFRKKTTSYNTVYNTGKLECANKKEIEEITPWLKKVENKLFIKQKDTILAIDKIWEQEIAILQKNLYLKKAGITIGEVKNKGLVPAHDLAVSTLLDKKNNAVALDEAQSLQYLKRQNIENIDAPTGWCVATYKGLNLGWMKVLPNRVNNYYPNDWRILKD